MPRSEPVADPVDGRIEPRLLARAMPAEQVRLPQRAANPPTPTPSNRTAALGCAASHSLEQEPARPRHDGRVLRRGLQGALAGIGREIAAADLHAHPCRQRGAARAAARPCGRRGAVSCALSSAASRISASKVSSALMDFSSRSGSTGRSSSARGAIAHGLAVLAEGAPQHLIAGAAHIAEGADPGGQHGGQGLLAHPEQFLDRQADPGSRAYCPARCGTCRRACSNPTRSSPAACSAAIPTDAVSPVCSAMRRRISAPMSPGYPAAAGWR